MNTLVSLSKLAGRRIFVVPKRWRNAASFPKLIEVGRLEKAKEGEYSTGQLFLHKVFGYRGVVLFPWNARVVEHNSFDDGKELKPRTLTYYQTLIDARDCPHISAQTESVTFLGNSEGEKSLFAIPGLDYVAHEDMIPYTSHERQPFRHELFNKFIEKKANHSRPTDTLNAWEKRNRLSHDLAEVHKETTENVRITAIPFFMGSREGIEGNQIYWWRYCIRMENLGEKTVFLRERQWCIFSLTGSLETVNGKGVVGIQPLLSKTSPAFQYSSHVRLEASKGHMWGTFKMERDDGYQFDCKIPPFSLESNPSENDPTPPLKTNKP